MQKHLLSLLTITLLSGCSMLSHCQDNPFTVQDSIQMVHFNDPSGRPIRPLIWNISPDGSTVLLVTTRGVTASNVVESSLWTVDLRAIAKLFSEPIRRHSPVPQAIFSARGQLRVFQSNSYGSLITQSKWSQDSKAIYFLLEKGGGHCELDKIDIATRHKTRVSPQGYDVSSYGIDNHGLLYTATHLQAKRDLRAIVDNNDVVDTVRGQSFWNLLWPPAQQSRVLFRSDGNGIRPIAQAPQYSIRNGFSLSPDGTKVVALVPVEKTPITWKSYRPGESRYSLYRSSSSSASVFEYVVADLRMNTARPLIDSPSGVFQGYADLPQIVWSSKGEHVLVTNTFLPLSGEAMKDNDAQPRPCGVAYVNVLEGSAACITYTRSTKNNAPSNSWFINRVHFGRTERDVAVDLVNLDGLGRYKSECYSLNNGFWVANPNGMCPSASERQARSSLKTIELELPQGLDEPPSVWARDLKTSRRVEIWNPNATVTTKRSGTTSEYRWIDKDKRQWTGGLMLPEGAKPDTRYPLVIQTHGFNSKEFLVDGAWTTGMAARPLAAAGFAVLQVEDKHEQYLTSEEARIHVNGYIAAIDQLAASGIIDPERVGIVGFSRSSWFVEEALLESPDRFAAAVIADGVDQSYFQYMTNRPEMASIESERENGGEPIGDGLERWIKSAPDFRLSGLRTPLRLQAITPATLVGEWEIYASLKIQNKPVDMLYLPLGQHVLQNPSELMASQQGNVDWFRFWLKGEEDSTPSKRPQYERWEYLRSHMNR